MNELEQAIAVLKKRGATPADIAAFTAEWNASHEEPTALIPPVRPDASSALPRDRENASGDIQALFSKGQGRVLMDDVAPTLAAHVLNAVPMPRQAEAFAGMLGSKLTDNPMGYQEALAALDEETGKIPSDMRVAEQMASAPEAIPAIGATVKALGRTAPYLKIIAKRMPGGRAVQGAVRDIRQLRKAAKATATVAPTPTAAIPPGQTWTGFLKENMGPAMREHGDHASAIRALSQQWKSRGATATTGAAPRTLEEIVGNLELAPEVAAEAQKAATLEQKLAEAAGRQWKPRSAPKSRFEWFAEQQAKRKAGQAVEESAEAAEPTLEELLALSTQHIGKGGKMEDLTRLNPARRR